ncbi:MAG TPA: GPP34 family phosphoprotein [Micromonosporaceae bacterium]
MYTLPLADELFLVGHDQYSGKPQVSDGALDTGLAGAVMGELVLAGRLYVGEDTLVVVRDQRPYGERVSDAALAEVLKQQEAHPVRAWVEYLRDHARTMVAPRLVHAGMIERVQARQLLKQTVRYPATDPLKAAAPQARLRYMLDHPANLDEQTAVLGGLVLASGLDYVLGGGTARETKEGLTRMLQLLKPDLRALIVGVESAVAALALSARR